MTFDTFEESVEQSQPVEFFTLSVGAQVFRYTSAEDDIDVSGVQYTAIPIKRSNLSQSLEGRNDVLQVELPEDNTFVRLFRGTPPGQKAEVEIFRYQRLDTPTPEQVILYRGVVKSVTFRMKAQVGTLNCQTFLTDANGLVPRYVYSALCNHVLYDERCKVIRTSFQFSGTVTSVSDRVLTVPGAAAFGNGHFTAGYVEAPGGGDRRMVIDHTGDNLTLHLPFAESVFNETVTIFAGCDHSAETCVTKFSNLVNFDGWRFVPRKNVFATGLV